jgi:hypothetical protein
MATPAGMKKVLTLLADNYRAQEIGDDIIEHFKTKYSSVDDEVLLRAAELHMDGHNFFPTVVQFNEALYLVNKREREGTQQVRSVPEEEARRLKADSYANFLIEIKGLPEDEARARAQEKFYGDGAQEVSNVVEMGRRCA